MIYSVTIDYEPSTEEVEANSPEEAMEKAFALVNDLNGDYAKDDCWVGLIVDENNQHIYSC